jgi:hypothetical protein
VGIARCAIWLPFSAPLVMVARVAGLGSARSVVAESLLVARQLRIFDRSRKRACNLPSDRVVAGSFVPLMRPGRVIRSMIVLQPSTPLSFIEPWKYRRLFPSKGMMTKLGPKEASPEVRLPWLLHLPCAAALNNL